MAKGKRELGPGMGLWGCPFCGAHGLRLHRAGEPWRHAVGRTRGRSTPGWAERRDVASFDCVSCKEDGSLEYLTAKIKGEDGTAE
jgi:hypothetical protein